MPPVCPPDQNKVGFRICLLVGVDRNTEVIGSPLSACCPSIAGVKKVLVDQNQVARPGTRALANGTTTLAALIFVTIPFVFLTVVSGFQPGGLEWFFRIVFPIVPATILAFLVRMIGYVNRDAGRRGMNRLAWTLIVIFVPNAIGFIIYFLMRNPLRTNPLSKRRYNFHPTWSAMQDGSPHLRHLLRELWRPAEFATVVAVYMTAHYR